MKVLVIGPARSIALEQWVTEMIMRGHDILILSPDEPRPAIAHLCASTEMGTRLPVLRFAQRIRRIRSVVREFKPDVLHGHGAVDYGFWAVLARFKPTLVTAWGSDVLVAPGQSRVLGFKVRASLRGADYLTATSKTLLDAARQLARKQIHGEVLSWGVDTRLFHPGTRIPESPIVFLSVRSLKPLYNIDIIIRAFARVREEAGNVRLIIVGDGSERGNLVNLVADLGISSDVEFRGWVEQADLPSVYRSAHVYVSVPSSDASAVSNMEAMASGLGIVVSDLSSTREWIRHDSEGLFVATRDVETLYQAMMEFRDTAFRERLGQAARDRVVLIGQRQAMMDRASAIYDHLGQSGCVTSQHDGDME